MRSNKSNNGDMSSRKGSRHKFDTAGKLGEMWPTIRVRSEMIEQGTCQGKMIAGQKVHSVCET